MEFKLLECTLRDGGYQVNWDFSETFVSDYLDLCSNLDIKNIELGFRFFDNNVWRGKFAYTTEEVISKLNISNDVNLGVMLFSGQAETNNKAGLKTRRVCAALGKQGAGGHGRR